MVTRKVRRAGIAVAVGAAYAGLQWLGRTHGATRDECRRRLPGDDLVVRPLLTTTHATTIDAPPEAVWPWLVQVGWHRGGWYTARWVDRLLFPANDASADHIVPGLQRLEVGDWIPDGPPESRCGFVVREIDAAHHLVLHSTEHLPPEFAERFGAWIDWSWVFVVEEVAPGRSRFLFRTRARLGPRWLAAGYWLLMIPADFVMARQMCRGLRARVEGRR